MQLFIHAQGVYSLLQFFSREDLSRPYTRQLLSLATQQHYHSWVLRMEILNATFYKLLENRPPVYFQETCRMYHAIFHAPHA